MEAAYAGTFRPPWNVKSDAKLMMLPRRPVTIDGCKESICAPMSRQMVKTEFRFTCITWHSGQKRTGTAAGAGVDWKTAKPR